MGKRKRILFVLALFLLVMGVPMSMVQAKTVNAKTYSLKDVRKAEKVTGVWEKKGGGLKFRYTSGGYAKNKWINAGGTIYYMNGKGLQVSGWVKYRNQMYYLKKNGGLKFGWLKNRYYLKANGIRAKGITSVNGKKYYFNKNNGKKKVGWVKEGKSQYYFDKTNGWMKTSTWIHEGGKFYYAGNNGKIKKSCWLIIGKSQYYLDDTGARVTGVFFVRDKGYYFKKNGVYDPTVNVKSEVNPNKPMVALTFDDGPGPYTARLLNCLQANNAKATFFMVGNNVSRYKSTVKRMASMGCELGNHSYSHPVFTRLSTASMKSQVNSTNAAVKAACGKSPTVFRLPYGEGHGNKTVLNALGLPSIYWSMDTEDWRYTGNSQHTVSQVLRTVRNGDIILMHDIHSASVSAAEKIIPELKRRGYQLVTVSQLAKYKKNTTLRQGKTYYSFR